MSEAGIDLRQRATVQLAHLSRPRLLEVVVWLLLPLAYLAFPGRHLLISEIAITALFALSLDLVLGYAGIVSLGHATFFGLGAYVAGIATLHGTGDPMLGLLLAGVAAAMLGFASSFLVLRGSDLTRLMVTLGVASVLFELANRLTWHTGGADGLPGIMVGPLFGQFDFDLNGDLAAIYSLTVLFILFLLARQVVNSPFG
jgi:branched-chain amino acid transport system permease protein